MEIEKSKIHTLEKLIKKIKNNIPLSKKEIKQLSDISANLLFICRAEYILGD